MRDGEIRDRVEQLRRELGGRAAGFWTLDGDQLVQRTFVASPDLDAHVARTFASMTQRIAMVQRDLGVVQALRSGVSTTSIAIDLSAEAGSGHWLRAFGAACSVAVPVLDERAKPIAVISFALCEVPEVHSKIEEQIRELGQSLLSAC